MFAVDTNILLYAINADAPEHVRCRDLVQRWRSQQQAWFITWGVCYEFLRVVTHPRILRSPLDGDAAIAFLESLHHSRSLRFLVPTERHAATLREVAADVPQLAGNAFHDAETAVLMREHGIRRIVTRDTGFRRFSFLEVVDPLALDA